MSSNPFSRLYANIYDSLYADKEYAAECDLIEDVLRRYGCRRACAILDLGCGTGGHAIPLALRGYDVTGVDRSPEMLRHARVKAERAGVDVRLLEGDVRGIEVGAVFDAVLLMFAVLSYQTTNVDVLAALSAVRRHLQPGGLTIFDVWYGPGVLTDEPGDRAKVVATPAGRVTRNAFAELDTRHHLCGVRYELIAENDSVEDRAVETHLVRYFFPMELELFLELAQLRLLSLTPFGSLDEEPSSQTWNVLVVAEAV